MITLPFQRLKNADWTTAGNAEAATHSNRGDGESVLMIALSSAMRCQGKYGCFGARRDTGPASRPMHVRDITAT
jgi:hypothetical protein